MEKKKSYSPPVLSKAPKQAGMLRSNMCQLTAVIETVYKFELTIIPPVDDSLTKLKHAIVKRADQALSLSLGKYVHSGNHIYALKHVAEVAAKSSMIDAATKEPFEIFLKPCKEICMKDMSSLTWEQCQELEMVFNILLRKVMEGQKLVSLRNNRYLNLSEKYGVEGTDLVSVTGYFVSISAIKNGLYLTVDTVNEFFRKSNCLADINRMRLEGYGDKDIESYFRGKCVSSLMSKGKTVHVIGVDFALTPWKYMDPTEKIPIGELWEKKYKVPVKDKTQPLFKYRKNKEINYVIPEFCYVTGVEEEAKRMGKEMSQLGGAYSEPADKSAKITGMFDELKKGKQLEQYGMLMSSQEMLPLMMLATPQLSIGPGKIIPPEALSKGSRIMNPINFDQWLFVYEGMNYSKAESLYNTMVNASTALGVSIAEPQWKELKYIATASIEECVKTGKTPHQFVFVLLSDKRKYKQIKQVLDIHHGFVSQCAYANPKKMGNIPFASNLIRQINTKLGGDLYAVELPKEIPKNTMFVGIDVCHCGKRSVVGFYANSYTSLAHCYGDTATQRKGKELIAILVPFYKNALQAYLREKKKYPEYIFIYRDGVGRSQREQVINGELPQVREAIRNMEPGYNPNITLVIVNKRIHQRFLAQFGEKVCNPEPGTIVEGVVTEKGCDNFFMISARARAGTIKPTHYYIAYNDRKDVTKETVQKVSYAMSFMYYNAPGSVKVPAHIALADKHAYYSTLLEGNSNEKLKTSQSFI